MAQLSPVTGFGLLKENALAVAAQDQFSTAGIEPLGFSVIGNVFSSRKHIFSPASFRGNKSVCVCVCNIDTSFLLK